MHRPTAMTSTITTRTTTTAALATALLALSTISAAGTPTAPRPPATSGFTTVRTVTYPVQSVSATPHGVWTAGLSGDGGAPGSVVIERLRGGRWATTTLPVSATGRVQISALDDHEAWLTYSTASGDKVLRFDGRQWRQVPLPAGVSTVTTLSDLPGGGAMIGSVVFGPPHATAWSYDARRHGWTFYGSIPETFSSFQQGFKQTRSGVVSIGALYRAEAVVTSSGGDWQGKGLVAQLGPIGSHVTDWHVLASGEVVALGAQQAPPPWGGVDLCKIVNPSTAQARWCSTNGRPIAASALLGDGSLVMARSANDQAGAGFTRRASITAPDTALRGSLGAGAVELSAAPGSLTVWAVTATGTGSQIRSYTAPKKPGRPSHR